MRSGCCQVRLRIDASGETRVDAFWRSDVGDLQAGWGDEEAGARASNPHYNPELYASYSAKVRKNLAHLDENRIDYELLEELLTQLAADPAEGAILLFLPGGSLLLSIQGVLWAVDKGCKLRTLGCALRCSQVSTSGPRKMHHLHDRQM